MDHITPERLWNREFRVDTTSMAKGSAGYVLPRLADPGVMVFTDGSQVKNGYTGAGIVLTRDNAFMRKTLNLLWANGPDPQFAFDIIKLI